jgi:hypothetical protein
MGKPTDEKLTDERSPDEKLTRLFPAAFPGAIRALEPDPYLPARIRAMVLEGAQARIAGRLAGGRRWVPVWLGATALAVAMVAGGYLGYATGTSLSAGPADAAPSDEVTQGIAVFAEAWSQAGFADDLTHVEANGE